MNASNPYNFLDQRRPLSHIAFIVFSLIGAIILGYTKKYFSPQLVPASIFFMIFVQIEVFIYFGNLLFARLSFDRKPGEITRIVLFRLVLFLAACLLASLIIFITMLYSIQLIKGESLSGVLNRFIHYEFRNWFKSTIAGLSSGAIIFIFLLWQTALKGEQRLREENLIFQNETLKNQINPHFLFNSLNTLSSLLTTRPDVAEQFIGKLSSIYRYILENSSKDKVPLGKELSFINDYFFLHKIRDEGKIELEVNINDPDRFGIIPVSLQILVENAIKHNKATREDPLKISVFIEDQSIVVKNNLQRMATRIVSTGIGLKNLSQRVKLITGKHLVVEETDSYFLVEVPLLP